MFQRFFALLLFLFKRSSNSTPQGDSQNILILGSLGAGKSSLVNMLIGRPVAPVTGNIGVAHPAIVEYSIPLSAFIRDTHPDDPDMVLRFYDTLGLDHRPSPWGAIKRHVKRRGGVHLVVYCMRRGRLSADQVTYLRTISKTYCSGSVPLLLVINSVDFRRGSTVQWWETNGEDLRTAVQVEFTDHICLNTCDPDHPSWRHKSVDYEEAQRLVRDMVVRHCKNIHSSSS